MQSYEKTLWVTVVLLVWPSLQFSVFCVVEDQNLYFHFKMKEEYFIVWGLVLLVQSGQYTSDVEPHLQTMSRILNYYELTEKKITQQQPFSHYTYFIIIKKFI